MFCQISNKKNLGIFIHLLEIFLWRFGLSEVLKVKKVLKTTFFCLFKIAINKYEGHNFLQAFKMCFCVALGSVDN